MWWQIKENGAIDLRHVKKVSEEISKVLKDKDKYHLIAVRSTILPGTTENEIIPIVENYSGKKTPQDIGIVFNPEFLREGSSVHDFFNPSRTVIGGIDQKSIKIAEEIYSGIDTPVVKTNLKVAEMIKYVDNVFHGIKVSFANEIGQVCKNLGIDSYEVMNLFCMDKKLNLSPYYLKPGFAFGGSCLPKDIMALSEQIDELGISAPLIKSILDSNEQHINQIAKTIINFNKSPTGIFGIAFKGGTDDLRNSAALRLANILLDNGEEVFLYDPVIKKEAMQNNSGFTKCFLGSEDELVEKSKIIVLNNKNCNNLIKNVSKDKLVIDLGRYVNRKEIKARYYGVCW